MKFMFNRTIVLLLILVTAFISIKCNTDNSLDKEYPVTFIDSNALTALLDLTGAEKVSGKQMTYTDANTQEHILVKINIINPSTIDFETNRKINSDSTQNYLFIKSVVESILESIGYNVFIDSLVVQFTNKKSFLFLLGGKYFTLSQNENYLHHLRVIRFKEHITWQKTLDSMLQLNELEKVTLIADSLSQISRFSALGVEYKIYVLMLKLTDGKDKSPDFTKFKSLVMQELEKRPLSATLYYYLACNSFVEEHYSLSAEQLDITLRQLPNHPKANYLRGCIYMLSNDTSMAKKHFLQVQKNDSSLSNDAIKNLLKSKLILN